MLRKYEVIRLIKQNAGCHIVMDYVEGEILVFYLKNHPVIEKEQLFLWIRQIIRQLADIQHVRGMNSYGYVTPYCMVVKQDKSIAFLDLKAESNAAVIKNMRKPMIQNTFFPIRECDNDCYPLARTIQFLFAHVETKPALTKKEEYKFQKIISRCLSGHSKQYYSNLSDILKEFPKRKEKKYDTKKKVWLILLTIAGMLFLAKSSHFLLERKSGSQKEELQKETGMENALFFEIGLSCFADLQEYEKSGVFFRKSKRESELGAEFEELAMFMCGKSKKSFHEIENLLEEIEKKLPGEESGDSRYTRSLLKVYTRIDSEKARTKSLELGKILLEKNKEYEKEIHEQFAVIYMKDQDYEKAIEECENVLKYGESVVTYKMLIELYETTGQEEKALEAAEKALEKMPESQEISIAYIRILCRSKTVEKEVLEKCIKECVEKNPELLDDSKFKKLQIEYGIQVEGENIWVEK